MISAMGLICAGLAFVFMGIGMPGVILLERTFGKECLPVLLGLGFLIGLSSLFISNDLLSASAGILGGTIIWGALELPDQAKRVQLGWYPDRKRKVFSFKLWRQ
jgi:hypothetical protein